ncbi:hypothetical protein K377_08144, partial [Streptomyces sp. PsTaAH-137]
MRRPVTGEVHVHYSQIYVESTPDSLPTGLSEAFAGQSGGLCGAAVPGSLWLVTGLHTGDVGFAVEVHDEAPPLAPVWQDVVEVSFRPASEHTSLVQWAGEATWNLGLAQADYRVRYCARGMDEARKLDTRMPEEPQVDSYLLQFWPEPPRADRVVRQTSQIAAYWHRTARELPPPPTPEQRAETERQARRAEAQAAEEIRLHHERWEWGGRLPSARLRAVEDHAHGLLRYDSDLVHALDASGPEIQRSVASLAAGRACATAGLVDVPWVGQALRALTERRPLPPPFDDTDRMWEALDSELPIAGRPVSQAIPPERPPYRPPTSETPAWSEPEPRAVGPASRAFLAAVTADDETPPAVRVGRGMAIVHASSP